MDGFMIGLLCLLYACGGVLRALHLYLEQGESNVVRLALYAVVWPSLLAVWGKRAFMRVAKDTMALLPHRTVTTDVPPPQKTITAIPTVPPELLNQEPHHKPYEWMN